MPKGPQGQKRPTDGIGNAVRRNVSVDGSITPADVSVSLGLIVTELVINALKHAFPNDRKGKIQVDFHSGGPNWTLSVSDDGIGMPLDAASIRTGLGSNIVHALAMQLHASIDVADTRPGTRVSIAHTEMNAVQGAGSAAEFHAV